LSSPFNFMPIGAKGNFLAISYAPTDKLIAAEYANYLHNQGFAVWYSSAGAALPDGCNLFVPIISDAYVMDRSCISMVSQAMNNRVDMFPVVLDEMDYLPPVLDAVLHRAGKHCVYMHREEKLFNEAVAARIARYAEQFVTRREVFRGFDFPASKSEKDYVFISYSHKDTERIAPYVNYLKRKGFDIWYDRGIHGGEDWMGAIINKIGKCAMVVAFVSDNYITSHNCVTESAESHTQKKQFLPVFIDELKVVPTQIRFAAATTNYVNIYDFSANQFPEAAGRIEDAVNQVLSGENNRMVSIDAFVESNVSSPECTKLIEHADFWLKRFEREGDVSHINQAQSRYKAATEQFSTDPRGWLGLARCVCLTPLPLQDSIDPALEELKKYEDLIELAGGGNEHRNELYRLRTKMINERLRLIAQMADSEKSANGYARSIELLEQFEPHYDIIHENQQKTINDLLKNTRTLHRGALVKLACARGKTLEDKRNATHDIPQLNSILTQIRQCAAENKYLSEAEPYFRSLVSATEAYIHNEWKNKLQSEVSGLYTKRSACKSSEDFDQLRKKAIEIQKTYDGTPVAADAANVLGAFVGETSMLTGGAVEKEGFDLLNGFVVKMNECQTSTAMSGCLSNIRNAESELPNIPSVRSAYADLCGKAEARLLGLRVSEAREQLDKLLNRAQKCESSDMALQIKEEISRGSLKWPMEVPEVSKLYTSVYGIVDNIYLEHSKTESRTKAANRRRSSVHGFFSGIADRLGSVTKKTLEASFDSPAPTVIELILLLALFICGLVLLGKESFTGSAIGSVLTTTLSKPIVFCIVNAALLLFTVLHIIISVLRYNRKISDDYYLSEFVPLILFVAGMTAANVGMLFLQRFLLNLGGGLEVDSNFIAAVGDADSFLSCMSKLAGSSNSGNNFACLQLLHSLLFITMLVKAKKNDDTFDSMIPLGLLTISYVPMSFILMLYTNVAPILHLAITLFYIAQLLCLDDSTILFRLIPAFMIPAGLCSFFLSDTTVESIAEMTGIRSTISRYWSSSLSRYFSTPAMVGILFKALIPLIVLTVLVMLVLILSNGVQSKNSSAEWIGWSVALTVIGSMSIVFVMMRPYTLDRIANFVCGFILFIGTMLSQISRVAYDTANHKVNAFKFLILLFCMSFPQGFIVALVIYIIETIATIVNIVRSRDY